MTRLKAQVLPEGVIGYECKHAFYSTSTRRRSDLLTVKLVVHYADGRREPVVHTIPDFKRSFWITKEGHRNHTDKKEWELASRLDRYETTQIMLNERIAKVLGKSNLKESTRRLARSPFLYGCDITTPVLIKHKYMHAFPDAITEHQVAVVDIETDVVHGTGEIVTISITFKDKVIQATVKSFVKDEPDPVNRLKLLFTKYLGEYEKSRNIKYETVLCDTPAEAIQIVFAKAHEWKPDIMSGWNIDYDLTKMIEALEKAGIDPAEVFNAPEVPPEYRYFKYIPGAAQKVTADGDVTPLHPADRWHVVESPASFAFIDYMCLYKKLRTAKGNEADYKLNTILEKVLGVRKLRFEEAAHVEGQDLKWHHFMQSRYPLEYCIYNTFDCIGVECANDSTKDMSSALAVQIGHSEYSKFPSQPRRTCDDLHFFVQEHQRIMGTTSDMMVDDLDQYVLSMRDWIVTLPSHQTDDNGLCCLEGLPNHRTHIRKDTYDDDVEGAYPIGGILANVSKETTMMELSRIKGIPEKVQRAAGVNLSAGTVNAIEIAQDIFKFPPLEVLLHEFKLEHGLQ